MNVEEHHLIMLMEECAEAAQRASKQLRFGRDEVQPGQDMPNHRRLRDEILDVLAVVGRLQEENLIDTITHSDVMEHRRAKQAKVDRMMALSRAQGRLAVETSAVPCGCYECSDMQRRMSVMIVCLVCGNKRCPKATDHQHACTGSNEPGQPGSRYS